MAQITLNIPSGVATRVLNAVCYANGWRNEELHGPKLAFAKAQLVNWIMECVKSYEGQQAASVARQAAIDDVVADIEIT